MSKKRYGLTDTRDTLYEKYMLQNPASSTSKVQFYKNCPLQVKLTQLTQQRQCLCQRHANMALRLMVIKLLPKSRDIVLAMSDGEVYRVVQELPDVNTTFRHWMRTDGQWKNHQESETHRGDLIEGCVLPGVHWRPCEPS